MITVAVFFADGFEDIEALSPVDYLRRAGLNVITVGVKGIPYKDTTIVKSSHNVQMIMDMNFNSYLSIYGENTPNCVVCPGGSNGATNLASNIDFLAHLEKVYSDGNIISAICASPAVVLGKTTILSGKKWTCYPGMETEANPSYIKNYSDKVFITDGKVITSRGPGSSEQFAMELVRILAGQETYEQIKNGSQQR